MTPTTGVNSSNTTSDDLSTGISTTTDALANEQTFLTLLVSQIKNQDPLDPTDSVQFLTQLTQFSQLEQSIDMRTDLDKMSGTGSSSSTSTGTSQTDTTNNGSITNTNASSND